MTTSEATSDIMSVLLDSEIDGAKLDEEEILDVAMLFLACLDTVQGAIGFQFMFPSQHPAHRDRLVRNVAGVDALPLVWDRA